MHRLKALQLATFLEIANPYYPPIQVCILRVCNPETCILQTRLHVPRNQAKEKLVNISKYTGRFLHAFNDL